MDTSNASILAWLKLLDPEESEIEIVVSNAENPGKEFFFRVIYGGEEVGSIIWNPRTLKGVMDHALRLATIVHRMPVLMEAIAEREARLRSLRSWINAPVKKQIPSAPSSVCLLWDGDWHILGRWVPDLIDRGGGRPVLLDPGDDDMKADPQDLSLSKPEVIFIGTKPAAKDSIFQTAMDALLERARITGRVYLIDRGALTGSGPQLYDSVFTLAAGLFPEINELESERAQLTRVYQPGTD